jgi:hypothetical protein
LPHGSGLYARLIAKHQHNSGGVRVHPPQCGAQRGRTPGPGVVDRDHVGPVQRDHITHGLRGATQGDYELVKPGAAGDL